MTAMSKLWQEHALHWDDWKNTPLRPCASEVFSFERIATGRTLLLGATQELRHITPEFADINENGMDWLDLPFDDGTFDTIIGDGVTVVAGPSVIDAALKKVNTGGIVAFRVFLRNTDPVLSPDPAIRKFQQLTKSIVPVQEIFDRIGPSPTTNAYNHSDAVYWLPTLDELPTPSYVIYQTYNYSQYFPIIVWTV